MSNAYMHSLHHSLEYIDIINVNIKAYLSHDKRNRFCHEILPEFYAAWWRIENRGKLYSKHLFSFWVKANVEIVFVQSGQSNHSEQWAVNETNQRTAIFCLKGNNAFLYA